MLIQGQETKKSTENKIDKTDIHLDRSYWKTWQNMA